MAHTTEPLLTAGLDPESILQKAVTAEITSILEDKIKAGHLLQYFLLSRFGLDIGVFTRNVHGASVRFIELKAFAGARPGGVGFGNPSGAGVQIDLLIQDQRALLLADEFIRWVVWDATQAQGVKRFAVCTNSVVKTAAMGGVRAGKQNNLRVQDVMKNAVTWASALDRTRHVSGNLSLRLRIRSEVVEEPGSTSRPPCSRGSPAFCATVKV